jgi:hypothetical protein
MSYPDDAALPFQDMEDHWNRQYVVHAANIHGLCLMFCPLISTTDITYPTRPLGNKQDYVRNVGFVLKAVSGNMQYSLLSEA